MLVVCALAIPPILSIFTLIKGLGDLQVLTGATTLNAFANSLTISLGKTILALSFAFVAAWLVVRTDAPFKRLFETSMILLMLLPPFAVAIGWILLLSPAIGVINGVLRLLIGDWAVINIYGIGGVIWVLTTLTLPYAFLIFSAALTNTNVELEESSYMCGANKFRTMIMINLPIILPATLSAFLISFVLGIEAFDVPLYLGMPVGVTVLTTLIYQNVNFNPPKYSEAAALSILTLLITVSLVIYYQNLLKRQREFVTVTGKMRETRVIPLGRYRFLAGTYLLILTIVCVLLPLSVLALMSLSSGFGLQGIGSGLTLNAFADAFRSHAASRSVFNSLFASLAGASIATGIGLVATYVAVKRVVKFSGAFDVMLMFPISVPPIVLSYGMFFAYLGTPIYGTIWLIALAFSVKGLPWVLRALVNPIAQVDNQLEEASLISGADRLKTFIRIVTPIVLRPLVVSWTLAFLFSMRELSIPVLLYFPRAEMLSAVIFELWSNALYNQAIALTMVLVTISTLLTVPLTTFLGRFRTTQSTLT
ncbi:MAG: iron ABC transporter permease [Nitrososphaerota archaeon]|nr:iron ABC transporter permease [Nitrososphaerota archaeon]